MINKIEIIKKQINELNADGILINSEDNRLWFANFLSSAGYLFINKKSEIIFLIDGRYYQKALQTFKNTNIKVLLLQTSKDKTLKDFILEILKELDIKKLGLESEYTTLKEFSFFSKIQGLELISFDSYNLRKIKTELEIQNLQIAANIAANTIEWIKLNLKEGLTELEISRMISIHMLELGASKNSFDPIVAIAENGANPHHKCSNKKLSINDMVTVDIGCIYNGYCSDITRSFIFGSESNNKEIIEIYNKVLESQLAGIQASTNKVTGKYVDNVCREIINNSKYKDYFNHSTGHGVGIQVHELPNVTYSNNEVLENNNVITIEPGIYVPGVGGVRIEDTIVIKDDKPIILTRKATKDLYIKVINYGNKIK